MDYLSNSGNDIERIAILDDNDEGISDYFEEEYISVNRFYGLTPEICDKVKAIFN